MKYATLPAPLAPA